MQTSLIEVNRWVKNGRYVDGHFIRNRLAMWTATFSPERLARLAKNATVDHHPELRKPRQ